MFRSFGKTFEKESIFFPRYYRCVDVATRHAALLMRRGIRVTDSRYNGPANTGRTRSAARTVPKGREGRRDKRKESSYASRDADTATVRETRTVRRTRRERRPRVQVKTGFSPWHAPFARSAGAEREGGKGSTGFPYVGMTMTESEGRRWRLSTMRE